MVSSIDKALKDSAITLVERNDAGGVYKFRVEDLNTLVTIHLMRSPVTNGTRYERSHAIKTPEQLDSYYPSKTFEDDPGYALQQAISSITMY